MTKDRKEHGNSTWDSGKWKSLIECIKRDVTQDSACAYAKIPVSTLHDWLNRDKKLSEEYERSTKYMDVMSSNAITEAIVNKNNAIETRAKYAMEWKKRRDKRYYDKREIDTTTREANPLKDKLDEIDAEAKG